MHKNADSEPNRIEQLILSTFTIREPVSADNPERVPHEERVDAKLVWPAVRAPYALASPDAELSAGRLGSARPRR
jgi:hypothetical protein